jgi:ferredoxin-NADP reductase
MIIVFMGKTKVQLKDKKWVASGTIVFIFSRPEWFNYKAGQYVELTLINPKETDKHGNARVFSLVSAPHERDLQISTRARDSAFKRCLVSLSVGNEIELDGPYGAFTLHEDEKKKAVFLIGGIGITPIISILRDAKKRKLSHELVLFYSNRRPEDAVFLDELKELAKDKYLTLIPTITDLKNSQESWIGEEGYINEDMVKKYIDDAKHCIFYVVGPPKMVRAMNDVLEKLKVPSDNIKMEEFSGY